MNRLILVGNGFDLAHGLKTDYNSFIVEYLKKCLTFAFDPGNMKYEDELITVTNLHPYHDLKFSRSININVSGISELVDFFYKKGLHHLLNNEWLEIQPGSKTKNPFKIKINSELFRNIMLGCKNSNWVDIENEFYSELKRCFTDNNVHSTRLNELNISLSAIIRELEAYLIKVDTKAYISGYKAILDPKLDGSQYHKTMILNFNYTDTIEKYSNIKFDHHKDQHNTIDVNYIHGKLGDKTNPLIFGFGDELDEDYRKIELKNNNDFFKHIKSFGYFKTKNYTALLNFINHGPFEAFIMGHSCGLSDRTLLNMIFEHKHSQSVQIYYYEDSSGNNFTDLTYEISRHFGNKAEMRLIVKSFPNCFSMPQL